ncbi:group II intron maturase-specific domain-containing protein, partial [Bacillus cereus]|uniref:group II intron maturase-specific domain-containing protein n=1 Tax=Bacillus cereus TaxID=1396 RepID=UPI002413FE13
FDLRRKPNRNKNGFFVSMIPNTKARTTVKAKIRELIQNAVAKPAQDLIKLINALLTVWVNYFRVGISSQAFSEVRYFT